MPDELVKERGLFWSGRLAPPAGHFAHPDAIGGILIVDAQGRIRVDFDQIFPQPRKPEVPNSDFGIASIHGFLTDTKRYIRIWKLMLRGMHFSATGSRNSITANYCLAADAPFRGGRNPSFTGVRFSLKGYEEWLGLRSIRFKTKRGRIDVSYKPPKPRRWRLTEGTLAIEYDIFRPSFSGSRSDLTLSETARFTLSGRKPFDFEAAFELTRRVEDFIILMTDSNRGLPYPQLKARGYRHGIDFYYFRGQQPESEALSLREIWVEAEVIFQNFGIIFDTWLAKHEVVGAGFNLLLANKRRPLVYPEYRFASFVWGLEALHRRLTEKDVVVSKGDPTPLEVKMKRILDQVQKSSDRKWLQKLFDRNEAIPLATRITELFRTLPIALDETELKMFSAKVAERRNDISHEGGQRGTVPYSEFVTEVYQLAAALEPLYHARVLTEIGVPDSHIRRWFKEGPQSFVIRQKLAAVGLNHPRWEESEAFLTKKQFPEPI